MAFEVPPSPKFHRRVEIVPDDREVSDRSLDGSRFAAATGYRCPPWPALVAELAADATRYESLIANP